MNHDVHGRITSWRITLIKSILCTLCGLLLWLALIAQAHAADVPLVVAAPPHSPKNLDPTLFPNSDLTLISSQDLDTVVNQALQTFYTPGAAVAIVHDGKIVHAKGYGKRHIEND